MPDTNIIENVWTMLDQELAKMGPLTKANLSKKNQNCLGKNSSKFHSKLCVFHAAPIGTDPQGQRRSINVEVFDGS
jgi:hypothetical protein